MTFALGHLVGAWFVGKIYEPFSSQKISPYTWFFLLLGGLLPDGDFILDWTTGSELHRTFTHSLAFIAMAVVITYIVFAVLHNREAKAYSYAIAAGIATHLFLDIVTSSYGVPLFWPSLLHFSRTGIQYFDPATPSFLHGSTEELQHSLKLAILDMAIGAGWILYLSWRKRIEF